MLGATARAWRPAQAQAEFARAATPPLASPARCRATQGDQKSSHPCPANADTCAPQAASKTRRPASSPMLFDFRFMQACKATCSSLLSTRGRAAERLCGWPEQQAVWATPRLRHMIINGRVIALSAAALGLTLTWLHRRSGARHRSGGANSNGSSNNHCRGVKLVPRGRPLVAQPDEVSLVSYNILCERCGRAGHAAVVGWVCAPAAADCLANKCAACLPECTQPCQTLILSAPAAAQVRQRSEAAARVCAVPRPRLPLGPPAGAPNVPHCEAASTLLHTSSCWPSAMP